MRSSYRTAFRRTRRSLRDGRAGRTASAELIIVDGQVQVRDVGSPSLPARGASMKRVEERFGAPVARSEAVGQPPITRWDYDGFSVYFEFDKVIHTVARAGA